jgi:hypothetical protein|tara:strand:- start:45 stop:434 length:390 start_codon:yes stop_codon:yes gene_type:complete
VRTQLLCTFTTESSFEDLLTKIFGGYELFSRKIFILRLEPSKELVISYNIIPNRENKFLPNTIMVHRKKDYNTMYTINALNRLIKDLNSGVEDKGFQVNWNDYKNSMILTDGDGYKIMTTKLFRIVDVK